MKNENKIANSVEMHVTKRNNKREIISFDKILRRIKSLGKDLNLQKIIYAQLAMKVIDQLYDNIETSKIDELTAEQCASMSSIHPDYSKLASAIIISNLHKNTSDCFYETMKKLYDFKDVNKNSHKLIHTNIINIAQMHKELINNMFDYKRDYLFDYFGFKTLERAYLMRCNNIILERPQHMWMRVSLCIHGANMEKVEETYNLMSQKYFIHATPTLFNAGTPRPQLSSCYLIGMESDSIDGIFNTVKECAQISKWSGGIGLHIHNIRSSGSHIRGTNGTSNGLIPMLGVFNKTARYVDQGGKRNGSFAIYLEAHHPDIEDFLDLKKNHGDEESKCRDLFYGLWLSDLFMERVIGNKIWSLFCPDKCPGLSDCYGEKYNKLYLNYENQKLYNKQINARDLWIKILDAQMETGTPYILYKDSANSKSNQKNLGTIKSSNLCVAPETYILTENGQEQIQNLKDKKVNVWNGKEFSKTTIRQTNDASELIEIHCSDGSVLTCTKYHKFYIKNSNNSNNSNNASNSASNNSNNTSNSNKTNNSFQEIMYDIFCGTLDDYDDYKKNTIIVIQAKDLQPNMELINSCYPILDNTKNVLINAYAIGYNSLYEKKQIKKKCFNKCLANMQNNNINSKIFVPNNYSLQTKIYWLAGLCDSYGIIHTNSKNNSQTIEILCNNKEFLYNVKLMLQTCGINVTICTNTSNSNNTNNKYSLLIDEDNLFILLNLGFKTLVLNIYTYNYTKTIKNIFNKNSFKNNSVYVSKIVNNNRIDKTFCFNEPKRHAGIFNGIITSQCTEIIEYSDDKETAVCNLASLGLPNFVKDDKTFDYAKLYEVTQVIVNNLNNVIDINFYPTQKTKRSNFKHRPIGIGIQGLADTFFKMDLPFTSLEAKEVNKQIFETIYYASLEKSYLISKSRYENMKILKSHYINNNWSFTSNDEECRDYNIFNTSEASSSSTIKTDEEILDLLNIIKPIKAEIDNFDIIDHCSGAYCSFKGSPISKGLFQFDLWNSQPATNNYDWNSLRENIKTYGIRNSLLVAPMPTASTSQILGNNECFEPITSNIYSRKTLAGEFVLVNKYLVEDLLEINMWNESIKNNIIANKGSISNIANIPNKLKEKYQIVWEMSMKDIINMSRDRGIYICQSQSLNLWMEDPDAKALTNMHFFAWRSGLKTGIYYLRRKAKHQAQQFTIEPEKKENKESNNDDGCLMCSG
jgi:ribonucleoside-diphosphate reductase alpha chain